MSKVIKPLLATKAEFDKIQYPVLATPKLDGIRCLMVDGIAMSRSMKPIPNKYVQEQLKGLHGLDGELMLNGDYNVVQSGIMSQEGEPEFYYSVFDNWSLDYGYPLRLEDTEWYTEHPHVRFLHPIEITSEEQLLVYLEECLDKGYEGVMIRQPNSKYKFGRSTVNQGILLKIKKFFDDEATIVDITEKMTNMNALEVDELGYAKRSSKKENLVPADTAGSVIVQWQGKEFRVGFGPGLDDIFKQTLWDEREERKGELIKFSYQELSKDGVPRFGKMLGFRHEDDL